MKVLLTAWGLFMLNAGAAVSFFFAVSLAAPDIQWVRLINFVIVGACAAALPQSAS